MYHWLRGWTPLYAKVRTRKPDVYFCYPDKTNINKFNKETVRLYA